MILASLWQKFSAARKPSHIFERLGGSLQNPGRTSQGTIAMTRIEHRSMSSNISKRPVDFLSGWPNPQLLPPLALEAAAHRVLSDPGIAKQSLRYAPDPGYAPLRDEIAAWLTSFYVPRDPIGSDRICITGGASQNLACILQSFTDPIYTRNIFMVSPTYFLACRIMDDNGFAGKLRGIPEDDEGIDIDVLSEAIAKAEHEALSKGNTEPKLKSKYAWRKTYKYLIYAVPTFANPSGSIMSLRRREQLVRLARQYDALIVTDDVYDMLQWPAKQSDLNVLTTAVQPRLVDVDRYLDGGTSTEWGNALSNGSFSKCLAPGARTGWAECAPKLCWALSQCGSSRSGGAPSHLVASMVHQMLAKRTLQEHIRNNLLPAFAARYSQLMQSIESHLYPLGVSVTRQDPKVSGGYFIWLTLPAPLLAEDIRKTVQDEENVKFITGPLCCVQGDEGNDATKFERNIRLCFAYEVIDLFEEGIQRIAKVIREKLATSTLTE